NKTNISELAVSGAEESLAIIKKVLNNEAGPAKDIVTFNSGAAIYVAGLADSLEAGIEKAEEVIASGAAKAKLEELVKLSNNC
ncbi:MAG: anthranilate phosphoribosyltransferase, partial [Gammaproteobacteria bacterium]|nr:anthranilate phosphoribosyltransferase [Gammaproteobacteria bacterium]